MSQLAMRGELDQRWAQMRQWVQNQDALRMAELDRLLVREGQRALATALSNDAELLRMVRRLAALALDESLQQWQEVEQS